MDWKTALTTAGWHMTDSCSCDGTYKETFAHRSKPEFQIKVAPNANWFEITRLGSPQGRITLNNMETSLSQI